MQNLKATSDKAVRSVQCKELALHRRTILVQKVPTHYPEKLTAYPDETPAIFDMLTNITVEAKGLKSALDKITGNKQQRITVMLFGSH